MEPLSLVGGVLLAFGAVAAGSRKRWREERARAAELRRRHETAMRIDRIRRRAEDDMLRSAHVIDGQAVEEP
jgi:hypothetical protein